jgi:hypothetical protein
MTPDTSQAGEMGQESNINFLQKVNIRWLAVKPLMINIFAIFTEIS